MTIATPTIDWWAVAPEIVLAVAAILVLLIALAKSPAIALFAPALTLGALASAFVLAVGQFDHARLGEFALEIDADQVANLGRVLAAGAGFVAVLLSLRGRPEDGRDGEHYALILCAVCGMGLFAAAGSLVSLFVGLELFSISLYVLCALDAERVESLEAGLKYLIVGGVGSAALLYGAALIYGATGTFDLSEIGAADHRGVLLYAGAGLVLAAMAFKASLAPLHWWTPDVYDGAPTTVTAFMATATKAVAFLAMARVLVVALGPEAARWEPIVAALAATSIIVGNLGALVQHKIKRMLAYSSVAHAGYLMIGIVAWKTVGIAALSYALMVYVTMTLGAFALVILEERRSGHAVTFDDLAGRGWQPVAGVGWLAALPGIAMVIMMLSLAGIPPTAGFFAKLGLFDAAVRSGHTWLAVVGVLGSAVSLGYYLRVPVAMYMRDPAEAADGADLPSPSSERPVARPSLAAAAGVLMLLVLAGLSFPPGDVMDPACSARQALLIDVPGASLGCNTTLAASDTP